MKQGTLDAFAARRTQTALLRVEKQLKTATKHPEDADAIHDLRVAIRRCLQCLRTFGVLFEEDAVKRIRKRLRRLIRLCGETRNCDIAVGVLTVAKLPATSPLFVHLKQIRGNAERDMVQHLAKKRWIGFAKKNRLALCRSSGSTGPWNADKAVASNATAVLPQMCSEFFSAGAAAVAAHEDYETLHQFRLRGKRFRYTLELFRSVYGPVMKRRIAELRGLQDKLGEINDCLTTLELIAGDDNAAGYVQALLAQRDKALDRHWRKHFPAGTGEKWCRWLARAPKVRQKL